MDEVGQAVVDVLQVITSTARRGAERFAVVLHDELADRGMTVRTVALVAGQEPTLDVEALGAKRLGHDTLAALREAASAASVVVAHGSTTLPASYAATLGTGTPFVYRNIGDPRYWATSRAKRLRGRLLLGRAAAVVALTAETGRRLTEVYGVAPERISAIPRGVPEAEFGLRTDTDRARARQELGVDQSARLAVCIGALSPEKNVTNAVRAMDRLPQRWHLLIAGDGPDRPAVEAAISGQGGTGDRVRLLGHIDNPARLLAAADVLVLPSQTEGLPGVVIEAGMVGIPSVATDVGFVSEIIDHGVSGRIVTPDDSLALAEGVLACEPQLTLLGRAAHRRASERFSLRAVANRWHELLVGQLR